MWRMYIRQHPTWGPWYQRVERQPGWVTRVAVTAAVLVVVVPLTLLALAAIVVGLVLFITLGLIAQVIAMVRALLTGGSTARAPQAPEQGRRNVRVIHDE